MLRLGIYKTCYHVIPNRYIPTLRCWRQTYGHYVGKPTTVMYVTYTHVGRGYNTRKLYNIMYPSARGIYLNIIINRLSARRYCRRRCCSVCVMYVCGLSRVAWRLI